jgi:hypothetical protein
MDATVVHTGLAPDCSLPDFTASSVGFSSAIHNAMGPSRAAPSPMGFSKEKWARPAVSRGEHQARRELSGFLGGVPVALPTDFQTNVVISERPFEFVGVVLDPLFCRAPRGRCALGCRSYLNGDVCHFQPPVRA